MRRFLLLILLLIFSVWLGLKIAADPGYALFSYRNWTMEMPLWFAILSLVVLMFLVYMLMRFSETIDISLYRFKNWLRWRRKNKSYSKTNRGLIELIEAHWRTSEYYLLEGVTKSDAPLINYLAAAKAADAQGAFDRRDNYLRKAHDFSPRAEIPIGLTQAQLQMQQGQLEQALATLKHLYSIAPRHVLVLKLLEKTYVHLADWTSLLTLISQLRKNKIITSQQEVQLEKRCYVELMQNAAKNKAMEKEIWMKIPRKYQTDAELVSVYANIMLDEVTAQDELEQLIVKALKKSWDSKLVKLYGDVQATNSQKQLANADAWLTSHNQDPMLLLTLGKLGMRFQLWGKAKQYLQDSLKLSPRPETYLVYGKLLEKLNDREAALIAYREGLEEQ